MQPPTPPQNDEFSIKWHLIDPPNNPTSNYGACQFGYNLALSNTYLCIFKDGMIKIKNVEIYENITSLNKERIEEGLGDLNIFGSATRTRDNSLNTLHCMGKN